MTRLQRTLLLLLSALVLSCTSISVLAVSPSDWSAANPENLVADHIFARSAILIDFDTGEVLFEKNPDALMFPASTTKIMTLLLALESNIPLDTIVTIPAQAIDIPADSSKIPVSAGEQMSFGDLLYGFMLNSGNDGAVAIAIIVSGSEEQFVVDMNNRAIELGCTGTHFVNSHGYHDNNHYTTARDMAIITREAMKNPVFRKIVATDEYVMAETNMHSTRSITSRVEMVVPGSKYYLAECTGIKTGYHSKAGQCFVGSVERGGRTIICVNLFSTRDYTERKWFDSNCMFQYAYTCYDTYGIDDLFAMADDSINTIIVENASENDPRGGELDLILSQTSNDSYTIMVLKDSEELVTSIDYFKNNTVITPTTDYLDKIEQRQTIEAGSIIGSFSTYTKEGENITGTLIAGRTVELEPFKVNIWDYLTKLLPFLKHFEESRAWYILVSIIVLVIIIVIVSTARIRRRERRRKRIYEQRRRAYLKKQSRQKQLNRRDSYDNYR